MAKATNGDSASGTSSHLMALEGKRIAIIEELKDVTLDIDQIKRMTGGGKLTGRELFKKQSTFLMTCKLMALLNQMPKLDADAAVKRRVFTLPFNAKFYPVANAVVRDDTLKGDAALPHAFFAWCVEGAVKFYKDGLGPTPACCDTLKLEFEASNDKVSSWIENSCNTDDSDGLYPAADAFHAYSSTMLRSGFKPLGKQEFYRDMQQREYRKDKYQGPLHEFKNKHCFFGIKAD
jgi:phage/plasmid-associated DNA primase